LFLATADTPKRASRPESGQAVAYDQLRGQCSSVIAQSLNLEHEFHHTASKLRVFGFEPFKQSLIARTPPIKLRFFRIPYRLPSTLTCKLQASYGRKLVTA